MLAIFLIGSFLVAGISGQAAPCAAGDVPATCIVNPYCMPQTAQTAGCVNTLTDAVCDLIFTKQYFKDLNIIDLNCNDSAKYGQAIKGCAKACGACCQDPSFSCTNPGGAVCTTFSATQCTDPALKSMLQAQCPALCGTCSTVPGCTDSTSINCALYAGLCHDTANGWDQYLSMVCPKTCGTCGGAAPTTTVKAPTPPAPTPPPSSACGNDPRCPTWVNFCNNSGYTYADRVKYCGVFCGFCRG